MRQKQDLQSVGKLVEALNWHNWLSNPKEHKQARLALIALLPQIQASDARLLHERHRIRLSRFLTGSPDYIQPSEQEEAVSLVIAILKAFEQIGDVRALPEVESLASGKFMGRYRPVQLEAQRCLPALLLRVTYKETCWQMFRAIAEKVTLSEVQKRPAFANVMTTEEQRIRFMLVEERGV